MKNQVISSKRLVWSPRD